MARSRSSKLGLLLVVSLLSTLVPLGAFPAAATEGDLLITGVIHGPRAGSNPKAVELLAVNDIPNLNLYGLGSADDGLGSDGQQFTFPIGSSASAGEFIYVSLETTQFNNFFGFNPDFLTTSMNVSGNDAIELFGNGQVIDVYGQINVNGTGQPWEYAFGWAHRVTGTGADGSTFVPSNWVFSGANALSGSTSTNATSAVPFPIGSYGATPPTTTTSSTTSTTTTTSTTSTTSTTTTTTTTMPAPTTTTTTTTTLPVPPPSGDVEPPKVWAELDRHWARHDRGWFKVDFACRDRIDRHPECVATLNGIPVRDGQKVHLIRTDGHTRSYRSHGILYIKAPTFELVVTGTDDAGNRAIAKAKPYFRAHHPHRRWC